MSCHQVEPITRTEQKEMVSMALEYAFDEEFMGDAKRTHPIGAVILVHLQEFPHNVFPESAASRKFELLTSAALAEKKTDVRPFYYLELHFDDDQPSKRPIIYVVTRGFYYDKPSKHLRRNHAESLGVEFTKSNGGWAGKPTFHMIE